MVRIEAEHAERMRQWAYMASDEFYVECNQKVLNETHEDITPPWEE